MPSNKERTMPVYEPDELFDLVDTTGNVIGQAPRRRCHGDPSLRHQAVHVLVFDQSGRLFLQKRSMTKDTSPGLWDTSVGGHFHPGEKPLEAARREFNEELGVEAGDLRHAYSYEWSNSFETERITAFVTLHNGPFILPPEEIEEGRFWTMEQIEAGLARGPFTPQFKQEFARIKDWLGETRISQKNAG